MNIVKKYYKNKRILVFGIFLFLSIVVNSQNSLEFEKFLKLDNITELEINSLLFHFEEIKDDSLSYMYWDYARWYYKKKNLPKAAFFANKSLKETPVADSVNVQRRAYLLAFYFKKQNKNRKSIKGFEKSILFRQDSVFTIAAYEQLAILYDVVNEPNLSLKYWDLLISYYSLQKNNEKLKEAYFRSAGVLSDMDDIVYYSKGINYIKKADSLINITETSYYQHQNIKMVAARLYDTYETLDIPRAENYLLQAQEYAYKERDTTRIRQVFHTLGTLYNSTDKNKSIGYLKKSFEFTDKKDSLVLLSYYADLGFTYNYFEDYHLGLNNQFKALEFLFKKKIQRDGSNLTVTDLRTFSHFYTLRRILPSIAEAYLKKYVQNGIKEDLRRSLQFFKLSDLMIDVLQEEIKENNSRLFWRKLSSDLYNKAIKTSYLANDLEQAFYYMEKNKMLLLLQDQNRERYKESLEISEKIKKEQDQLENEIINYEKELTDIVSLKNQNLNEKILSNRLRIKTINDSLGVYQDLNIDSKIISLKELQNSLNKDELKISYHASSDDGYGMYSNKDNGYVLFATKDNAELIEINELGALKNDVIALASSFQTPVYDKEAIDLQKKLSYSVYERLFPNDAIRTLLKDKKVVISPDDFLSFLPFDALQTSLEDNAYLIKECEISYAPSHSFQNTLTESIVDEPQLLAIAPVTFTDDVYAALTYTNTANKEEMGRVSRSYDSIYTPLTYSKDEISGISNYYKGKVFLGKSATKTQFAEALSTASIVHLSTHAGVDKTNDKPWIAFRDERLTGDELYLMKNKASLIFLSGCETNIGEIKKGEGVMSLARSFFSGGAQSVISTLWSIDDKSSSEIVKNFYKNLSKGKSKSASLREAKLAYLDNSSLSEKSPYYWGAFVLIGNDASIPVKDNTLMYVLIFALLMGIVIVFMLKRRSKKKANA